MAILLDLFYLWVLTAESSFLICAFYATPELKHETVLSILPPRLLKSTLRLGRIVLAMMKGPAWEHSFASILPN